MELRTADVAQLPFGERSLHGDVLVTGEFPTGPPDTALTEAARCPRRAGGRRSRAGLRLIRLFVVGAPVGDDAEAVRLGRKVHGRALSQTRSAFQ